MPSKDTEWVIISKGSEILQLYNLFCNIQNHHMPLLSEQLLVITSTFEPVGAIKQNLECDSLLILPRTAAPAPGGGQDGACLHKSNAPGGRTPEGRREERQQ